MNFLDQEADESGNDEVLVPSSQTSDGIRPRKRRRIARHGDEGEYDLPSPSNSQDGDDIDLDAAQYKSKYDNVMHVVQHADTQKDTFVTQLTQPWSSPTRIRGPRWLKKTTPPTPTSRPRGNDTHKADHPQIPDLPVEQQRDTATDPRLLRGEDDEFDDDDPALLHAFMSSPMDQDEDPDPIRPPPAPISRNTQHANRRTALFGMGSTQRPNPATQNSRAHNWPLANRNEPPTHHKIDSEAMKTWTYPINLGRIRDYQYNIVHKSLFSNLLVALPTGLGKTFIAATVMLNWYRWTKDAQIVFVAPTKPLVYQQAEACYQIAGIPKNETIILTGEVSSSLREDDWKERRVFFMTPQTFQNDLDRGIADPKRIVLVVVDEAHKATGNYAYVKCVQSLRRHNSSFRVLGLTATPGGNIESVQKVIDGLDIARVEIRTEESIDIREFVHTRDTQTEVFDNSDELNTCLELFSSAVGPVLTKLGSHNAYWGRDPAMMTLYGLRMAQQNWTKSDAGRKANYAIKGWISGMFRALMSLAHNLELLKFHGIGPFYHKMKNFDGEAYGMGKEAKMIVENEHYKKLMNYMRSWVNNPDFVGHPKLEYLNQVVLNHFMDAGVGQVSASGRAATDTRIMVFAHYRDSAEEVVRVLKRQGPMVKPHIFVGQSGTKGSEGMNQKKQLEILKDFKSGKYNTLVATSIGEEGLDIGEVDLIVCYDSSKSPIRMLQRMGRTGRKRAGKIAVLLMRGKEENDFLKAKDSYQKMQEIIESGKEFTFHDDLSPRIVPRDIIPVVDKRVIDIPIENTQGPLPDHSRGSGTRTRVTKKRPKKQLRMPEGVETGITWVGGGKKWSAASRAEQLLDSQIAILPPTEQVFLTADQQLELEQHYQQIAGSEPQYIDAIRFGAFPDSQRKLQRTSKVKHSVATTKIVSALRTMRDSDRDWTRPSATTIAALDFGPSPALPTQTTQETAQHRTPTRPARRSPKTSVTLDSSDRLSPGEYDDADSFIDDALDEAGSPTTSPDLSLLLKSSRKPALVAEKPFWVSQSQKSNGIGIGSISDEDDLPDLGTLVGVPSKSHSAKASRGSRTKPAMAKRRTAKRVIDSDEDD